MKFEIVVEVNGKRNVLATAHVESKDIPFSLVAAALRNIAEDVEATRGGVLLHR